MAKGVGDVLGSLLSNDADVSAVVGNRIFPFLAIEDVVYPYIVYTVEDLEPTQTKCESSVLDVQGVTVEIYTEELSEIEDLKRKVRNLLDRFSGTVEGIDVQSISFRDSDGGYADEDRVYMEIQTYSLRLQTINATFSRVTDLLATGISSNQINLSWSDVATGETGYEVWRSLDSKNWTLINTTAADATSFPDTGLDDSTAYVYRIRAINTTQQGEWSNISIGCTDSPVVSANDFLEIEFDTRISAITPSDSFKIEINGAFTATVDKGEVGSDLIYINTSNPSDSILTLQYAVEGIKTIKILGTGILKFNSTLDSKKILDIKNFGTFTFSSMNSVFRLVNGAITANDTMLMSGSDGRDAFKQTMTDGSFLINTSSITLFTSFFSLSILNADLGLYDIRRATSMTNFAVGVTTWSTENYGKTLRGWLRWDSTTHLPDVGWVVPSNLSFNGGNSTVAIGSEEALARTYFIDILNWSFIDGGEV